MNAPLTPDIGFFTLLIVSGLAGWIVASVREERHWLMTNALVGVAGSWFASQLASLLGIVVRGSLGHFTAALIGAVLIFAIWKFRDGGRPLHAKSPRL